MPNYLSHAIFGDSVYKKIKKKIICSNIRDVDLRTYSFGVDMAYFSKCRNTSHNLYTREFILTMIKYIKDNELCWYKNPMAYLYGHIGHYFLDKNMHPFIYYMSTDMKGVPLLSSHTTFEFMVDAYLLKTIMNEDILSFNRKDYCFSGYYSDECKEMTNFLYKDIYGVKDVSKSYSKFIKTLMYLESISNMKLLNNIINSIVNNYDVFGINNMKKEDISNELHDKWLIPVTGEEKTESLLELYNKALNETFCAVQEIENYLYKGGDIFKLYNLFADCSYDTGVNCNLGNKMRYVKKY